MPSSLIGGSDLRARLAAVADVPPTLAAEWAAETVTRIRATKPPSVRPQSSRFTTKATQRRAGVYGAFWWIFVDRGTKAHDIEPRRKKALRFESHGQTIFASRVHRKRMARRPFISKAAQASLHAAPDIIVKAWNRRRLAGRSHKAFL
jgi:hypothetical protein